jgi:small subunit ribosomal protein S6
LKNYEGMLIFVEQVNDAELDDALASVKTDLERCGAALVATTKLGKRAFAREMHKQQAGHYVVLDIQAPSGAVGEIRNRLRLNEQVLRAQFLSKPAAAPAPAPAAG